MKILQVNKFHYPHGGADKYYLQLGQMLIEAGQEVAYFAMRHPFNLPTPYQKYFVSQADFSRVSFNRQGLKALGRMFWSHEVRRQFRTLVADFKPDIVHIHNIYHHLSPAFLRDCQNLNLPVIMTAHDYKLVSPNYSLFSHGHTDDSGRNGRFYEVALHKSIKNSYLASLACALEAYWHQTLRIYSNVVTLIVCPSRFMLNQLAQAGWSANKLVYLPNYTYLPSFLTTKAQETPAQPYFLYTGRLSPEKGLTTLLTAFSQLDYSLKLAGQGDKKFLEKFPPRANMEYLGQLNAVELTKWRRGARAVILPSVCYENCPLAILEAWADATAVIASRIGGIPELMPDNRYGRLFTPGSVTELQQQVQWLAEHPAEAVAMGEGGRQWVEQHHRPADHYQQILAIYEKARFITRSKHGAVAECAFEAKFSKSETNFLNKF